MDWFQQYASGAIKTLTEFKELIFKARRSHDAPSTAYERFSDQFQDGIKWDIPARLAFPSHFNTPENLSQNDRADWQHTDEFLQMFAARLIEALRRRQIPFYVHEAFRTREKQQAAFKRGNSRAQWPRAPHCQGAAVDIVHGIYHWNLTPAEWRLVGILGKDVLARLNASLPKNERRNLKWGGDFETFYDPAHWELKDWRNNVRVLDPTKPVHKTPRFILSNGPQGSHLS